LRAFADTGNRKIIFDIEYRPRKTMVIKIDEKGSVSVLSPLGVPRDVIVGKVLSRSAWIEKKLKELKTWTALPSRRCLGGHVLPFLGKEHTLHVKNTDEMEGVYLLEGVIAVRSPRTSEEHIRKMLRVWYRQAAEETFLKRAGLYSDLIGHKPVLLKAKEQKRRWGSCTSRGNIYINWKMIMAPLEVIDYVILHELVHLYHQDHSRNFWAALKRHMPDYRLRKTWLKENGTSLYF
jgi:predicted metal-dependent hydrolase